MQCPYICPMVFDTYYIFFTEKCNKLIFNNGIISNIVWTEDFHFLAIDNIANEFSIICGYNWY